MGGVRKFLPRALFWGTFLLIQTALLVNTRRLIQTADGVSLRYDAPLAESRVTDAIEYAREKDGDISLTFWAEQENIPVSANGRTAQTRLIAAYGDARRLIPQRLLSGAAPAAPGGCAVSSALAWRLWGAFDVAGMELTCGGVWYSVRGVFEDETLCLLIECTPEDGAAFDAVDVRGASGETAALSFARVSGLGTPAHTVDGGAPALLAQALCWLPLVLCAGFVLARLLCLMMPRARRMLFYTVLLAVVLCLPQLLAALPAAWLPTRWSDFTFWHTLAQSAAAKLTAWLALPPHSVDIAVKRLILRQAALCLAGCVAGCLLPGKRGASP